RGAAGGPALPGFLAAALDRECEIFPLVRRARGSRRAPPPGSAEAVSYTAPSSSRNRGRAFATPRLASARSRPVARTGRSLDGERVFRFLTPEGRLRRSGDPV